MKCFIASAFGHSDVDTIYDQCVIPVLRKLSVTPLRVDRVEHNEDIDNKIFELLDSADFVISDLTYARPSVYYEAGYATGNSKPVIYTVKSDHFKARTDDPYGNFRVHFDLQMRNIISWTTPNQAFSKKLLKRVQHVLRPLERQNQRDLKLHTDRIKFDSISVIDRLMGLQKIGTALLKEQSFSIHQTTQPVHFNGYTPTLEAQLMKLNRKDLQIVSIIATSSPSKRLFTYLRNYHPNLNILNHPRPKLSSEKTHYIVLSLKPVPRSRVAENLPYFDMQNNSTFTSGMRTSYNSKTAEIAYVHIIDGIKSYNEFSNEFRTVLNNNNLMQNT